MPENDEKNERPAPRSIRLPEYLEAALCAEATATGLSANAIITDAVAALLRRNRRRTMRRAEQKMLARLLAETAVVSDLLHEIALSGNDAGTLLLEQALARQDEIRGALLKLMGRKP